MNKGAFSSLFQGSRLNDLKLAVASHALKRVPTFLREQTGIGPWAKVDEFYRTYYLTPCTGCERDDVFASNNNGKGETQYAGVHYRDGDFLIECEGKDLFNGNTLNLLDYPIEFEIRLSAEGPPPEGCSGLVDVWHQLYGPKAEQKS